MTLHLMATLTLALATVSTALPASPVSVSVTELAPLPYVGRTSPAAYESVGNKLYFFGGYTPSPQGYIDRIRVFDLGTSSWSELPFRMPYPVGDANRAVFIGNHFYVTPGFTTGQYNGWGSHNRLIDVDLAKGAATESVILPFGSVWDMLSCGGNGKLYVFGGHTGGDATGILEFQPGAASVTQVANMRYAHRAGSVTLGADGWVYILGWSAQIERFHPATRAVQTLASTLPSDVAGVRQMSAVWHMAGESAIYFTASGEWAPVTDPPVYRFDYAKDSLTTTGVHVPGQLSADVVCDACIRDSLNPAVAYILLEGATSNSPKKLCRATLVYAGVPVVVDPPHDATCLEGSNASFTLTATGDAPLSYRWWFNATNRLDDGGHISGVTTTNLSITPVQATDAGDYTVVLSNAVGSVTSRVAHLTVLLPTPPAITSEPGSRTNALGTSVTFAVAVTGTPPLSYLWSKDGASLSDGGNVSGATTSTLTIASVRAGDAGAYRVAVSNAYGAVWSRIATLTITDVPGPTTIISVGGQLDSGATLSNGPHAVSWSQERPYYAAAIEASLFNPSESPVRCTAYLTTAIGPGTSLNDLIAQREFDLPGRATLDVTLFTDLNLPSGMTYYVTLLAPGAAWGRSGLPQVVIDNGVARGSTYFASMSTTFPPQSHFVDYSEIYYGNLHFRVVGRKEPPCSSPGIPVHPLSSTNIVGTTATFTMEATGSLPLSYQWRKNDANLMDDGRITGVTSSSLTVATVHPGDAGNYTVVVANACGNLTSRVAVLTVVANPPHPGDYAFANFAGLPSSPGSTDGTGVTAQFNWPRYLAVDDAGTVYVGDTSNFTIRKVTPAGVVTTLGSVQEQVPIFNA